MRRRQSIDSGHYRLKKKSFVDTSNTKVKAKRSENKSRSTLCNGPSNPLMKLKREGAYSSLRAYQGLGAERWQMKRVRRWHWRSLTHSSPDKKEKWKELGLIKWLFPFFFFFYPSISWLRKIGPREFACSTPTSHDWQLVVLFHSGKGNCCRK